MADTNNKDKHYHDSGQDRFEKSDASFKLIGIWMGVILILVLLTAFAVWGYVTTFSNKYIAEAKAQRSPLLQDGQIIQPIPGPELQLNPTSEMVNFAAKQEHDLSTYSWVSREAGVVRMPIEVAKAQVLSAGLLKSRAKDPESTATIKEDGASLPQDSSSGRTTWNLQR